MKKSIVLAMLAAGCVWGAEISPQVYLNFTGEKILARPQTVTPKLLGDAKFVPRQALVFAGKGEAILPGTENFNLKKGGTLHAVVNFAENGTKPDTASACDTILFKANEFVFARNGHNAYFNACTLKNKRAQWAMPIRKYGVPRQKWTALTITVTPKTPQSYTIKLYVDGKFAQTKTYSLAYADNSKYPISIGKGWGGVWQTVGKVAEIQLFAVPLSTGQVYELVKKSSSAQ